MDERFPMLSAYPEERTCRDADRYLSGAVRVVSLDSVRAEVRRREAVNGIRLVGVDGPSGSGKSTLAGRLAALLGAPVIEIDDFLSWGDLENWWPRFEAEVITPLLAGRDAVFRVRDWAGDEFGSGLNGWKRVEWRPTVVIEGLTSTRRAIAARLAYRVWVEAPSGLRLERGIQRDGESHRYLWVSMIEKEAAFFDLDDTRGRADLVVEGAPAIPHDSGREVVVNDV